MATVFRHRPSLITRRRRRFIGSASGPINITLNQVTETELAQSISWAPKSRLITLVIESEVANTITAPIVRLMSQVTETELANSSLWSPKNRLVTLVTEDEVINDFNRSPLAAFLTQIVETELPRTLTASVGFTLTLTQVTEDEVLFNITWSPKERLLTQVTETETPLQFPQGGGSYILLRRRRR